jgi:hypothetical protein
MYKATAVSSIEGQKSEGASYIGTRSNTKNLATKCRALDCAYKVEFKDLGDLCRLVAQSLANNPSTTCLKWSYWRSNHRSERSNSSQRLTDVADPY